MPHSLLTACRPSATDAHLARRAAGGDDDAFGQLYARYQPRLEAYCRSIVRHDEDARDAVQNAMTKALVALRRCDDTSNVQGWLFRIAHNESISLLRRRRATSELPDLVHDHALGPAGDLLLREELRATLDGVRALPGNLQQPLLLRELVGMSYGQVADVIGSTPAAARKAVFDARSALSADRAGRDAACSVIRQSLSEGDGRRRRARVVRSHLQSCNACCAWESEQRMRRHHLSALLPAAGAAGAAAAAGSFGGWLAGVFGFGGGSGVAAGISGGLGTGAKVAASVAVLAAGAVPVVAQIERSDPTRGASVTARADAGAQTTPAVRRARAAAASRAAAAAATSGSAVKRVSSSAAATTSSPPSTSRDVALLGAADAPNSATHASGDAAASPHARARASAGIGIGSDQPAASARDRTVTTPDFRAAGDRPRTTDRSTTSPASQTRARAAATADPHRMTSAPPLTQTGSQQPTGDRASSASGARSPTGPSANRDPGGGQHAG